LVIGVHAVFDGRNAAVGERHGGQHLEQATMLAFVAAAISTLSTPIPKRAMIRQRVI